MPDLRLKPCSVRRGGATHHCSQLGQISQTAKRGRWRSEAAARLCIIEGLAMVQDLSADLHAAALWHGMAWPEDLDRKAAAIGLRASEGSAGRLWEQVSDTCEPRPPPGSCHTRGPPRTPGALRAGRAPPAPRPVHRSRRPSRLPGAPWAASPRPALRAAPRPSGATPLGRRRARANPAWHRRARWLRGQARVLVRLADARARLGVAGRDPRPLADASPRLRAHHSAASPDASMYGKGGAGGGTPPDLAPPIAAIAELQASAGAGAPGSLPGLCRVLFGPVAPLVCECLEPAEVGRLQRCQRELSSAVELRHLLPALAALGLDGQVRAAPRLEELFLRALRPSPALLSLAVFGDTCRCCGDMRAALAARDSAGRSPLQRAVQLGWPEVAGKLLHLGAPADHGDAASGWSPLMYAISAGDQVTARALTRHGASVNLVALPHGWTPLQTAVASSNLGLVEWLLDLGADPEATIRKLKLNYHIDDCRGNERLLTRIVALRWPHLAPWQRLEWAAALRYDAVPVKELPPWWLAPRNLTRRDIGVDLVSLDGERAVQCKCCNGTVQTKDVTHFICMAQNVFRASEIILATSETSRLTSDAATVIETVGVRHDVLSGSCIDELLASTEAALPPPQRDCLATASLRPCQRDCIRACRAGARIIEMACGTGKTLVMRRLADKASGRVLVSVPSLALLWQHLATFPGFCPVGTGYNTKIAWDAPGYISVTDSVHLLENIYFSDIFVDEAHKARVATKRALHFMKKPSRAGALQNASSAPVKKHAKANADFGCPMQNHAKLAKELRARKKWRAARPSAPGRCAPGWTANFVVSCKQYTGLFAALPPARAEHVVYDPRYYAPSASAYGTVADFFSATHPAYPDHSYGMGQAIDDGVLCDYDLVVPVVGDGESTLAALAGLLLAKVGHFRRVLAYCNSIDEALLFKHEVAKVGLVAWHINGETPRAERQRVLKAFSRPLQGPAHVLVTVQVLGEGINIGSADTCLFVQPRRSYVSIVQAVGRVLRLHPSKPLAHIILPAVTPRYSGQDQPLGTQDAHGEAHGDPAEL
ncbi:unnamed protein product [Prorocentrum cordatum]|uniref:Helicase C-terminal domain-containing protein n=1 Tax=Prorocentrum cordatum TaxID=2364126 RepID=A0ABN9Q9U6_9DINO|nr:unnamed protein product [Polarella glacialis]